MATIQYEGELAPAQQVDPLTPENIIEKSELGILGIVIVILLLRVVVPLLTSDRNKTNEALERLLLSNERMLENQRCMIDRLEKLESRIRDLE